MSCGKIPGLLPLFHTTSDGKLGGAWERGYLYRTTTKRVSSIRCLNHEPQLTLYHTVSTLHVFFIAIEWT